MNKVATGVQLRWNVNDSPSLPEDVRARLFSIAHNRINAEGELIIEAKSERTQEQNRAEAMQRLIELLRQAAHPPKPRRATCPTAASRVRRLEQKRRRGQVKQERGSRRDLPQE